MPFLADAISVIRAFDALAETASVLLRPEARQEVSRAPQRQEPSVDALRRQHEDARAHYEAMLHEAEERVKKTRQRQEPPLGPYAVLGLTRQASDDVVKAAYRALMKKAHPDSGGSTTIAAKLNQAYEEIAKERKL